jgi:hypothetical protein
MVANALSINRSVRYDKHLEWSRTHGWVFIIRPHTGVPEIGRLISTQPCSDHGSALPVVSAHSVTQLRVVRHDDREVSKRMLTDRFLVPQYEGGQHTLTRP